MTYTFKPGDQVSYELDAHRHLTGTVVKVGAQRVHIRVGTNPHRRYVKAENLTLMDHAEPVCLLCNKPGSVCACEPHGIFDPADLPPNPRQKGDDDGVEYGHPRDYRDGKE